VNEAGLVGCRQRVGDLHAVSHGISGGQWTLADHAVE
jgi:hypothetical protein